MFHVATLRASSLHAIITIVIQPPIAYIRSAALKYITLNHIEMYMPLGGVPQCQVICAIMILESSVARRERDVCIRRRAASGSIELFLASQ